MLPTESFHQMLIFCATFGFSGGVPCPAHTESDGPLHMCSPALFWHAMSRLRLGVHLAWCSCGWHAMPSSSATDLSVNVHLVACHVSTLVLHQRKSAIPAQLIMACHVLPFSPFSTRLCPSRQELRDLKCGEIFQDQDGQVYVHVRSGKGGRSRDVPALPGHEASVLAVKVGHEAEALVFTRTPKHMDIHSYRRAYAQALYLHYALGRSLPPATGRLKRSDYNAEAVQKVSWALGHNRKDVVLRHYIR